MNQLSTLLLVDSDPHGLETLTYGFEREGCTVAGTSDPRLAPDLLRTTSPQLAVVSLRGPGESGLDVISGLRAGANGRNLPVVTLGPADLKPAALAAGATDFLPTPLFVRDVVSVGRLLTLKEQVPQGPAGDAIEIQSRLSEYYGLFYLLRAMAATERSGILLLSRGNRKAEVRFCEGTVMAAHVAALQGLPAVHHLLLWEEAALSLKFRAVPRRTQLHLSSQELLDECERFLRDLAFSAHDLGSPRTIYVTASPTHPARVSGLQPSQIGPVLRLFDGHHALAEVIEESPFRVFDTLRVVKRLLDAGALVAQSRPGDDSGPRSMMEQWAVVPDQRGVVGDRRSSARRLKPVPSTGSAPIPLTVKKAAASGEIATRKRLRTPPPAAALGDAPTVQVKLDPAGLPLAAPLLPSQPAPLTAQEPPTPQPRSAPAPLPPPPSVVLLEPSVVVLEPSVVVQEPSVVVQEPSVVVLEASVVVQEPSVVVQEPSVVVLEPSAAPLALAADEAPAPSQALAPVELPPVAPPASQEAPRPHRDGVRRPSGDGAVQGPALRSDSKNRLRKIAAGARLTPSTAFDAVEADFFAREADLYKHEAVESFDDLDPGTDPSARPPATVRPRKKR